MDKFKAELPARNKVPWARSSRDPLTDTRGSAEHIESIHWKPNFCWLVNKNIIKHI